MSSEIAIALALVLVIEGVLYALFPGFMLRMLAQVSSLSQQSLRTSGLISAIVGVLLVWLLKK